MPRVKDLNSAIPHGWRFVVAGTNFDLQKTMPHRSFRDCVLALQSHVRANRHVCTQAGLKDDYDSLARLVEDYSARELKRQGYTTFITEDVPVNPQSRPQRAFQPLENRGAGLAADVKRVSGGVKLVMDWLGSDLKPVPKEDANARALVCTTCPLNGEPNFIEKLSAIAAKTVKDTLAIRHDLDLSTDYDKDLHTCKACGCFLKLKVFSNLEHILANTSEQDLKALDKGCWILMAK